MYVSKPVAINDSVLVSNIPEPDTGETVWLVGTNYNANDEVIVVSTHSKYRSVQGSNVGNDPTTDDGTWWVRIAPTNKYAMFDGLIGTQSTETTQIQVEITAGTYVNAVSAFNVSATSANVTVNDLTNGEVYNQDIDMQDNSMVVDLFTYFFEPIISKRRFSLWDLPIYPSATVTVTFDATGDVSVGELVLGQSRELGVAQYGTGYQLLDFNVVQRDAFGNLSPTTDRRSAKLGKYVVKTLTHKTENTFNILDDLRGIACVWTGSLDNDKTLIYGYHSDARVNYSTPSLDDVTIEVEGLT